MLGLIYVLRCVFCFDNTPQKERYAGLGGDEVSLAHHIAYNGVSRGERPAWRCGEVNIEFVMRWSFRATQHGDGDQDSHYRGSTWSMLDKRARS